MKEEVWRPIKDYEGLYEISNLGRVKSLNYNHTKKEKILKNVENGKGYLMVCLTKNGKHKLFLVHRLVAEAFIPNPENKPCVDHINTIKNDNRVENLRWVTCEENSNNPLTKKKCIENNIGENNPFYGKHHTEETKKKISEAQKGEKSYMYGKAGKNNPNSKPVVQINPNTNEIVNTYPGVREAERQTGFDQSAISRCCRGEQKIHKGYKWMFLEDYEKLNKEN